MEGWLRYTQNWRIMTTFREELQQLINRNSAENGSNTPDFILAQFLDDSLLAFDHAVNARENWYGHNASPVDPFGQGTLETS